MNTKSSNHQDSKEMNNQIDEEEHQQQEGNDIAESEEFLFSYLESYFNHSSFLSENQHYATRQALLDSDLLVSLCQGKSITYQLPAAIQLKGTTVVIMPTDQCIQREKLKVDIQKVPVWWIDSTEVYNNVVRDMKDLLHHAHVDDEASPGLAKLIYISCSRFVNSEVFQELLTQLNQLKLLNQFVIEEIQCLESDQFPEYEQLSLIRNQYPTVSITVLTNALTGKLQHHILNTIKVNMDAFCAVEPSIRENIYYGVLPRRSLQEAIKSMVELIKQNGDVDPGLIYCFDREEAKLIYEQLQSHDIPSVILDPQENDEKMLEKNYQLWLKDVFPVGIATQTFRFNIHKPNVRFVFHYSLPASIEDYIQDTNIAGRDDQFSRCILFEDLSDIERLRFAFPSARAVEQIKQMAIYADNSVTPRRVLLEQYCSFLTGSTVGKCDNSSRSPDSFVECDLSADVKALLTCVEGNYGSTLSRCIDLFRGTTQNFNFNYADGSHYTLWEATRLAYLLYVYDHMDFENSQFEKEIPIITERGKAFIYNPSSVFKISEPAPFPRSGAQVNNKKRKPTTTTPTPKKAKKRKVVNGQKGLVPSNGGHFPSLHPLFIQYMYQAYPQLYQNLLLIQNQWAQRSSQGT